MKICIILGTRPEIIKMSPIILECHKQKLDFFVIHTNQHYSEKLDNIFFKELKLPKVKYNLRIGSGTHGEQTGRMLIGIEQILMKNRPDIVLVQGDTNTVLAGALAAVKLHITVGHIEAGLRSFDRSMPEEINRILTDHSSDLLFVPTNYSRDLLLKEGVDPSKIFITGNTVVDSITSSLVLSKKSKLLQKLKIQPKSYFVLTAHRQENTGDVRRLKDIISGMEKVYQKYGMPIIFPAHPRTISILNKNKVVLPVGLVMIEPVGYLDFISLQSNARLIFTDSGGVQEESCILRVPCVTLRNNSERPETIFAKSNILAGTNSKKILIATDKMLSQPTKWANPFGDGNSSKKILKIILKYVKN